MKSALSIFVAVLLAGCATSSDLAERDARIAELAEQVELLNSNVTEMKGSTAFMTRLIDDATSQPVVQVELIGVPDEEAADIERDSPMK